MPDFPAKPPALDGSAHAWHHPMAQLLYTLEQGGAPLGGKMPAFGNKLTQDEQRAVIAYFQSQWDDEKYGIWSKRNQQSP
ncbi:MAG: c-type cytochrome [Thiolinea sp.]